MKRMNMVKLSAVCQYLLQHLRHNINLAKKDKHYKITEAIKAGLTAIRLFYKMDILSPMVH